MMIGRLTTGVFVLAGVLVAAQPAPGSRVLVMPFSATVEADARGSAGASLWLGEAASLLLRDELARRGLTVVSRAEADAAFDRLQLPLSAVLTRATMIRVAELIGASELVFGDVTLGRTLTVRARIVAVPTGADRLSVTDAADMPELFTLFDRLGAKLAPAAGRPVVNAGAPLAHLPLEAFENYVKGLVAATPPVQQRFLESALRLAPQDPRILIALWEVYSAQGAHEKALTTVMAVPRTSPLFLQARFSAALSLVELGRLDGAFQELGGLDREQPSPVIANALGVVQLRRGTPIGAGSAATFFQRAVTADPGNTDYLFNLGYANAVAGETEAALLWLREALRYDAANGEAHLVMSSVLASAGRGAEARRELDLAKQLGTRFEGEALVLATKVAPGLERLMEDLHDVPAERPGSAIGNPAQRDQRETAVFHLERARRLIDAGSDRQAIDELRRAVYLAPYEDEPHVLLGQLYQRAGRLADAIDEFKVAIWCRETAAARIALGGALLAGGDTEGALREARRAVTLAPDSAEAKELLRKAGGE
jgi:tetratricopeptide (TPR) repeat protein